MLRKGLLAGVRPQSASDLQLFLVMQGAQCKAGRPAWQQELWQPDSQERGPMQAGGPACQQEQPALQQYFWQLPHCRSGAQVGAGTPAHLVLWCDLRRLPQCLTSFREICEAQGTAAHLVSSTLCFGLRTVPLQQHHDLIAQSLTAACLSACVANVCWAAAC